MIARITTSAADQALPDAPYRGIESLRFIDREIFVARKDETWTLLSNVTLYRGVLLYGETGTGKSSLINAGLLPRILQNDYIADRVRVQPFNGRELKIERIPRSDDERDGFLPSNFVPELEDDESTVDQSAGFELSLTAFRRQLRQLRLIRQNPSGDHAAPSTPFDEQKGSKRALLIFDQFEELITLFDEAQRGGPTAEAKRVQREATRVQRRILVTLIKLIRDEKLPIKIVFAFREDYLAKLSLLFEHCPELLDQAQRLLPPRIDALPEIIRAPFAREDLRAHFLQPEGQTAPAGSELTESLALRIAAALGRRSEGDSINLTDLQIVCLRLWQSPDPETLFNNNGIGGLLRGYYADVFGHLSPELHDEAAALLSHMITGSNTRNIISENDLLTRTSQRTQLPHDQLQETLDVLCDSQIVRRERRRDLYFYELASEYLVPWIKELVAEHEMDELAEQRFREWRKQRRAILLKRLLISVGVLLIVSVGLGAFALYLYKRSVEANRKLRAVEGQRLAAEAKAQSAQQQKERYVAAIKVIASKNDAEKLRLLSQILEWNKEGSFPPELAVLLVAAQSTTENQQIKQAAAQLLAQAARTDANLSQSIDSAAETNASLAELLPPRFYIHIANESQKPLAQKVANALKQRGYLVPGIQIVGSGSPRWDNELRYFRKDEEGMPAPADILSLLKQTTGSNWIDAYNPRYQNSPNVRPGHFEIWFPAPTGQLLVSFADDEGSALQGIKPTILFQPAFGLGVSFSRSRPGSIAVPPGDYNVTIKASGYKEVQRPLSIKAGDQVDWRELKLSKE